MSPPLAPRAPRRCSIPRHPQRLTMVTPTSPSLIPSDSRSFSMMWHTKKIYLAHAACIEPRRLRPSFFPSSSPWRRRRADAAADLADSCVRNQDGGGAHGHFRGRLDTDTVARRLLAVACASGVRVWINRSSNRARISASRLPSSQHRHRMYTSPR